MSEKIYAVTLLLVVVWPLLLAIPMLRARLPWPRHLAILPAALLTLLFQDVSLDLDWLLLGTRFAIDANVRWMLMLTVVVWLMAATVSTASNRDTAGDRATTFFLLTMAGNLGAVLAADLVGFFCFSTIMGYGFYGLLIQGGNVAVRRAGRLYIIFLVAADLALIEALLLAAFATEDLSFLAVQRAMAESETTSLYFWMAFTAFVLRAGIWPFHLWLTGLFKSASVSICLLLVGVPVATGLFGALRWLPLGFSASAGPGSAILVMGIAAMLFGLIRLFFRFSNKMLPAWGTVVLSGLFIAALGVGLMLPAVWLQYTYLQYPLIAGMALLLAVIILLVADPRHRHAEHDPAIERLEVLGGKVAQRGGVMLQWSQNRVQQVRSFGIALWLKTVRQANRVIDRLRRVNVVSQWTASITMFVLIGLALTWLAV
jgi:formate hydrogenlyase subunit 3/multisubunit Na+/H+ antiporter MnhD subunit